MTREKTDGIKKPVYKYNVLTAQWCERIEKRGVWDERGVNGESNVGFFFGMTCSINGSNKMRGRGLAKRWLLTYVGEDSQGGS